MNVLGCKWIYWLKSHADQSIDHHKARLVAQGFKQETIDHRAAAPPPPSPPARISSLTRLARGFTNLVSAGFDEFAGGWHRLSIPAEVAFFTSETTRGGGGGGEGENRKWCF